MGPRVLVVPQEVAALREIRVFPALLVSQALEDRRERVVVPDSQVHLVLTAALVRREISVFPAFLVSLDQRENLDFLAAAALTEILERPEAPAFLVNPVFLRIPS